jgi:protein-S-isoprenylcysteine O-methyltransferase Ste14
MPTSLALVTLQMAAILAVVTPWHASGWQAVGWLPIALAALLGMWTLQHNRPGNFSVLPEPKAAARLVTTGPYAHVRHPMYLAVLLAALGFALAWNTLVHWTAFAILALVLHAKALREERLLAARFPEYEGYAARTRRLIPFLL